MKNFLQSLRATLGQIGLAVAVLVGRSKAAIAKIRNRINPRYRSLATKGAAMGGATLALAAITGVHIIACYLVSVLSVVATAWIAGRDDNPQIEIYSILSVLIGGVITWLLVLIF